MTWQNVEQFVKANCLWAWQDKLDTQGSPVIVLVESKMIQPKLLKAKVAAAIKEGILAIPLLVHEPPLVAWGLQEDQGQKVYRVVISVPAATDELHWLCCSCLPSCFSVAC